MNVYLVTGQIATGKSYFTNIISKKGYKFFCADNFVGELYKDKNIIESIKGINKEFVIGNSINKDKIRNNIYEYSEIRNEIESLIHPIVKEKILNFIDMNKSSPCFVILPTVNNVLLGIKYKKIILIKSSNDNQIKRLIKRGYKIDLINKIVNYQSKLELKKILINFTIENNSSLEEFSKKIYSFLDNEKL